MLEEKVDVSELVSEEHKIKMQREGLFDGHSGDEPQFPSDAIYMIAYLQALKK